MEEEWGEGEEYRRCKREYKELCEYKKREENDKWEVKAREAKKESEVWEIISWDRRKRRKVNEAIGMEKWKEYFEGVLGGVGERVRGYGRKGGEEMEKEEELRREEIRRAIKKQKDGKALGGDEIPGEAWKYGGEKLEEWLWLTCNKVWKGEGWPEGWKEGEVIPIIKKGGGEKVEDYRGVTVMPSAYKVYAAVLAERLREEMDRKEALPWNQLGFRKGMGTIDGVYILNYLVNRQLSKEKGGLVALFVDVKAAFDSVDRGVLREAMRGRGIREGLVERVMETLEETMNRVRVGGEIGESFWTARGVRQGCPMSPLLFNLVIGDIDEEMGKVKWGGVRLGGERIYTLAYADDLVLLAENEEEMRSMIERLEGYLGRKNLVLNTEKTKVMRFRKGGGRVKKRDWRWRGKKIEEVKEFKYLGYTMQRNGGQEAHIKERVKRAAVVMRQVWGIGKRRFGRGGYGFLTG